MSNAHRLMTALVVVAIALVVTLIGLPSPHTLGGRSLGAALIYIGIYALATMLPVPKALFSLTAGVLFGPWGGIVVTLVGASVGATAAFGVARFLGRAPVERWAGDHVGWLRTTLERNGFVTMIGLRLIPVVPFTALNYAAGLSRIGTWRYLLATVVGIAPGASLYVLLGAWGRHPDSWPLMVSLSGLAIFWVTVAILIRTGRLGAWRAATPPVDE